MGIGAYEMTDWLPEQLKTCRNLTLIAEILINVGHQELLPTCLELLFEETQAILDEHCVVKV
jgi:hypothetical protein